MHFVKGTYGLLFVFCAFAGVRQGCPLSSIIFILATDAINRALLQKISIKELALEYADDDAICIEDIWKSGPELAEFFNMLGSICSMHLNEKKCIIIPVWIGEDAEIKVKIERCIKAWGNFLFRRQGKYLGYWIGPGAVQNHWNKVAREVLDIAKGAAKLKTPKAQTCMYFQALGTYKIIFTAQLRRP